MTVHILLLFHFLVLLPAKSMGALLPSIEAETSVQIFLANGIVEEIKPGEMSVVIQHSAISNFMPAMTMPFKVKDRNEMTHLQAGDRISFQLHVSQTESWIARIEKIGTAPVNRAEPSKPAVTLPEKLLLRYQFTNELGQPVSLNDFHGQALALAITFFYTRCPLPEFCPRLSKNFQETSRRLEAMTNTPPNWHFISVSFDPEFDTPQMLKAYGESYGYDPNHWSFLTGPTDKIAGLAHACGVTFEHDGTTINHDFRTLIVNAAGHLQMIFPTTGNLTDQIASEMLKAIAATNQAEINH